MWANGATNGAARLGIPTSLLCMRMHMRQCILMHSMRMCMAPTSPSLIARVRFESAASDLNRTLVRDCSRR